MKTVNTLHKSCHDIFKGTVTACTLSK